MDDDHNPVFRLVYYLRQLNVMKLPKGQRESAAGQMCWIMVNDYASCEDVFRLVRAALSLRNWTERAEHLKAIYALACCIPGFQLDWVLAAQAEKEAIMTQAELVHLKNRIEEALLGDENFRARVLRKNAAIAEERGKRQVHVAALLHILRENDIKLSAPQRAWLKKRPCEKLPGFGVASNAKSAADFMRQARKQ